MAAVQPATSELCSCKGIRTCLFCEKWKQKHAELSHEASIRYIYCRECEAAWEAKHHQTHPNHQGECLPFQGVFLMNEFITVEEESSLIKHIDATHWTESQSGRKKQDFGPKVNFKKKRLRVANFTGLPAYSELLYERLTQQVPVMAGFLPVELCNLDYNSERGSAIDPHFDDFWIWGERLVIINMLSDTYLTFTIDNQPEIEVSVPMLRRSLVVIHGEARLKWKHSIKRGDINGRRVSIGFRELTPEYLPGGSNESEGQILLKTALTFDGIAVGANS